MTSQKEQIQILITEIDSVLYRTNPRLPWVMSGEVAQQRQVLERVRNYLVALQQRIPDDAGLGSGFNPAAQVPYAAQTQELSAVPGENSPEMSPYQMMRAILQEVSYLRANLTPAQVNPPLNQQQLTAELLQVLMSRLQENLSQQIAQTLGNLRSQSSPYEPGAMLGGSASALANPQYEQLQNLRSRSDQMLVNLDSTLTVVFESLQRNIQAYQEALSQGLERMYSTGQQSEYTFKLLIDQLIDQLKQEASSYLRSSMQVEPPQPPPPPVDSSPAESHAALAIAPPSPPESEPAPPPPATTPPSPAFPYAGAEFLSSEISEAAVTTPADSIESPPVTSLDSAIESWLQSVSEMNRNAETPEEEAFDLPELDLSTLELGDLAPTVSDLTATDFMQPSDQPDLGLDLELDLEPVEIVPETAAIAPPPATSDNTTADLGDQLAEDEDTAEFDAALKLLEELSAELDHATAAFSLEDAEAQLDQMLSNPATDEAVAPTTELPSDACDELDEFYQSLFGSEEAAPTPATEPEVVQVPEAVSTPDLTPEPSAPDPTVSPTSTPELDLVGADLLTDPITSSNPETPLFLDLPADLFELESPTDAIAPAPAIDGESIPAEPTLEVDEFGSLTDLFQNVSPEATRSVPVEPPGMDGNFSFTPAPTDSSELFLSDDLFGGETRLEADEDQFTRAAPDENLLPNTPADAIGSSLDLDEITLSSLSEDLSSLEGAFGAGVLDFVDPEVRTSPELTLEAFARDVTQVESESTTSDNQEAISLDDFAAAITEAATPSPPTPYYQASPAIADITIEGFAELFDDEATGRTEPLPPPAITPTEPLPFTLEGTTSLFEEPASPSQAPTPPPADAISPFTLEGMDDLFGDAPSLPPPPAIPTSDRPTDQNHPAASAALTIEGMNDLFEDAPPIDLPPPPEPSASLDRTPQPESPKSPASTPPVGREIPPFKPELFAPDEPTEKLPPFRLEQLDNLFADATSNAGSAAPGTIPDKQSLDAAFESLLGTPPPAATETNVSPTANRQKKKKFP